MSNTHIPISLETNVRKLDNSCLASDAEVLRYTSSVTAGPESFGTGNIGLTTNEVKTVHKLLLRRFLDGGHIVARLSKDDSLVANSASKGGDVKDRLVVLTIYEGDVPPPTNLKELDYSSAFKNSTYSLKQWADFKRSNLPSATQLVSPSRRRYMKVHGMECNEGEMLQHDPESPAFNIEGVQFHLIPMQIRRTGLSVGQALRLISNIDGNDPAVGVSLPEFLQLGGSVDYHPEEPSQSRDFPGLTAINDPISHIRLTEGNELLLSETSHVSVFLKSNHKTLSDIVAEHCHPSIHRLQTSEGIEMLTAKFKGVQVGKRTSGGLECRTIRAFKLGTASDLLPRERHNAWPSEGSLILSPSFPLVDVGTVRYPLYLPMETCLILEKQLMRGPRDLGLTNWVNSTTHANLAAGLPKMSESVQGSLIFHQYPDHDDLAERLETACDRKSPNLLFVEAGSTVVDGDGWVKLRNELKESFNDPSASAAPQSSDSMNLLTLRYASGSDPSIKWTQQLQDFVAARNKTEQKTIIIVWLEPEQDHGVMYKVIKKACETVVGAQTFFVKRETYATQVYSNSDFKRSVTDIRLRICQKNPRMLKTINGANPKLAIAMHITQLATPSRRAGPTGNQKVSSPVYLVTLVSRDPTRSRYYHTEQGLYTESQLRSCEHVKLLQALQKILPNLTSQNIVILRSGTMLLPPTDPNASAGKVDLTNSDSFNTSDTSLFDVADGSYSSTPAQQFDSAGEIQAVRDVFNVPRTSRLNYIILTEDKILATRLDRQTYYDARPQDKAPAVLFIQDQLLVNAGECSIKVQQVPHSRSEDREKRVQIHPGAITATFSHTLQAAGEGLREITPNAVSSLTLLVRNGTVVKASSVRSHTDSLSHRPKPQHRSSPKNSETAKSAPAFVDIFTNPSSPSPQPKTPIKISEDSTELTLPSEPDDHQLAPSTPSIATVAASPTPTVHGKKESWEPSVSKADIDYLVGIWKDDDLGLYSTQWPVPTHLAQLATKRAMTRLRTDDWKNTTTAPFSLINVHENVRDTLYYL